MLDHVPSYDIKLVIGDYNAKIGQRRHGVENFIATQGSDTETNDNDERLTMMCSTVGLSCGKTFSNIRRHVKQHGHRLMAKQQMRPTTSASALDVGHH